MRVCLRQREGSYAPRCGGPTLPPFTTARRELVTCQACLAIPLPWDAERFSAKEALIMERVREALADNSTIAVNVNVTKAPKLDVVQHVIVEMSPTTKPEDVAAEVGRAFREGLERGL